MKKRKLRASSVLLALAAALLAIGGFSAWRAMSIRASQEEEQSAFDQLSALVEEQRQEERNAPSVPKEISPPAPTEGASPLPDPAETQPGPGPEEEESGDMLRWYAPLFEANPDLFGWLRIEGTSIDYPVMYTPEEPERYLRRAFDGRYSHSGTPFIDGACPPEGCFYLIYGHNMKSNTMFGPLLNYREEQFCREHAVICFDTLSEQREYQVMAAFYSKVYEVGQEGVFRYYEYTDLTDPAVFEEYVNQACQASLYETGVTAEYGDQLITLSTCDYHTDDGRFVVVAKRVDP